MFVSADIVAGNMLQESNVIWGPEAKNFQGEWRKGSILNENRIGKYE